MIIRANNSFIASNSLSKKPKRLLRKNQKNNLNKPKQRMYDPMSDNKPNNILLVVKENESGCPVVGERNKRAKPSKKQIKDGAK